MYLKSLTMRGFKTFADKTSIDFESLGRITAIVGPNGCGKSNIIDAIRWVLGEQSLKDLRSSSLEEVIFAGCSTRKPLSLAEVSLDFDNSDHGLQTEYTEVSVRRRIFRSSESEFFINKNACRLKDIRDLFLDTGLGKGSYSLINQGQVDAILSSSPEERRAPFEEAAGIAKYKSRREAAQRKMIATEQNLLRINDLMIELSSHLKTLEEQAGKAKEYKELKENLKEIEIGLAKKEIKSASVRKATLEEKIAKMREMADGEIGESKRNEEIKEEIKGKLKAIDQEVEGLTEKIEACKVAIEEGKRASAIEREREKNLEEKLSSAEEETSKLSELLGKQKEKLSSREKESAALMSELIGLEEKIGAEEKDLRSIIEKTENYSNDLNSLKNVIFEKERIVSEERNKLLEFAGNERSAKEEGRRDEKAREELLADKKKTEASSQDVDDKISALKEEIDSLLIKLSDLIKENAAAGEEHIKISDEKDKAKASLQERSSKLSLLLESREKIGGSTKELLSSHSSDVLERIAALYKTDQRFPQHKHRSFSAGETPMIGIAKDLITFDKKYEKLFSSLLSHVIVVSDLNDAFSVFEKIKKENPDLPFKVVTLSGDFVSSDGEVFGGGKGEGEKTKEEINILSKEVGDLEDRIKGFSIKEREFEGKRKGNSSEIELLEKNTNDKKISLATLEAKRSSLDSEISSLDEELDLISQSLRAREEELSLIGKDRGSLLLSIKMLEEECITQNDKLKLKSAEIDLLSERKEEINGRLLELKISHAKIGAESKRAAEEVHALAENIRIGEEDLRERSKDVILKKLEESREKISSISDRELVLAEEREPIERYLLEKKNAKVSLGTELEELENKMKGEGERERTLRGELLKEEVALAKLEGELTALDQRMQEEYGFGVSEVLASTYEVQNQQKAKSEAAEMKARIKALEPVNLLAIEEFEKARERLTFLETQSADLSSARENLKNLIEELDKKAKDSFLDIINKVAENFRGIFSLLFEGGEAKLMLVEGEDPLEAGIEILARPYGRKWLPLSLMSGGERALTAIAILFSLLKTHPSPFCFLDEVDAALDEANIHRFAKLLREFSQGSQMVVITHNKRTMAIADTIYGVTMEEAGASKIISMRMAKVAQT
ncbi:MAG: AAA family ATPase [Candidatus Saganbacteria bacterium]|nr:AAA family ATPase [Candidatus Saganbacteria bacterium]